MFSLPIRNLESLSLAVSIHPVNIFILNESAIWSVKKESNNTQIRCEFHPEEHADLIVSHN